MKKFYLHCLMMFSAVGAFAKATENVRSVYPHYGTSNSYTSFVHSRLIAKSHYIYANGALAPADSVKYIYMDNARGGSPALMDDVDDNVFFDSSYTVIYPNGTLTPRMQRIQTYLANNQVQNLTMRPWKNGAFHDSVRFNYAYNSYNLNYSMLMQIVFGSGWQNMVGYNNYFTTANMLMRTEAVAVGINIEYTYDGSNNMTTAVTEQEQDSLFYDSQNRVYSKHIQARANVNANWGDSERWSYFYTGTSNDINYAVREMYLSGSWQTIEKHLYTYDANHNRLTDITQTWGNNVYTNAGRLEWVYNSYNQPTELTSTTWNGSSWVVDNGDYKRYFYYQNFTPTGIHEADPNTPDISLYPVPATANVNMAISWKSLQRFTVSVCDITGRTVHVEQHEAASYLESQIQVADLPSGTYFLKINGENGAFVTRKFTVVH